MSSNGTGAGAVRNKQAAPLPSGNDEVSIDPASAAMHDAIAVFELVRGATLLKAVKNKEQGVLGLVLPTTAFTPNIEKPYFSFEFVVKCSGEASFSDFQFIKRFDSADMGVTEQKCDGCISQISKIACGQTTRVFESNPIPEYKHLSLSILYDSKKTLDIVFLEQKMYDIWLRGLQALVDGFSDIKAVAEVARRVGSTNPSESLKVKVAFDTLGQAKVSFTEEACDIYTWGKGHRSVLGHGDEKDQKVPEVLVALLGRNVKLLALGKLHTISLIEKEVDEEGEIYSWGVGQFGRLGHGNLHDRFLPLRVAGVLASVDIVHIACGEFHSAAVTDGGQVYTWGRSSSQPCGRLGYDCLQRCFQPTLVSSISNLMVSSVACGTHHTVVLTEGNQLFSFGENDDGQLGLGHTKATTSPQLIQFNMAANSDMEADTPPPVATKVACGTRHTAALFGSGLVFTCGDNSDGQLGLGNCQCREEYKVPQPFSIAGVKVVQVSCAYRATAALSATGKLYTWGCNDHGVLGHGDVRNRVQATEVQAVSEKLVRAVFCGAQHMAITVMRSWVPDEEAKLCMMCKKKFTTVRRRHHCRQCGGIFCGSCTTKRFPLLDKGYSDPQRVCDKCHAFLSQKGAKQ